jgi:tRNA A-37 threonylcarbamoyl transferase component Bud32
LSPRRPPSRESSIRQGKASLDLPAAALRLLPAEEFSFQDYRGEIVSRYRPSDLEAEIRRLIDPVAAEQTLHWGRNYLYQAHLQTPEGAVAVVVKQFRNQGLRARLRRRWRGSKAAKSWRVARAMLEAGLATPEPVLLVESTDPDGPSLFVCRHLDDVLEARYFLRAVNAGREEDYPELRVDVFLETLGRYLRRLHAADLWHRDVSIGNVLIRPGGSPETPSELYLVDLNRTRTGRRLTTGERTRDLSRMAVLSPLHQEHLLRSYWGESSSSHRAKRWLYRFHHRAFLLRHELKKHWRRPLGRLRHLLPRRPHAHIRPAGDGATARDKIAWDHLSDQPHQHANPLEKLLVRLADGRAHLRGGAVVLRHLPAIWGRYRTLRRELYRVPVDSWGEAGVCLRPLPGNREGLLAAVEDLGVKRLLIRIHSWETDHTEEELLAAELRRRGYDLVFAIPQNRELVRDLNRWRAAVEEIAERFAPFGHQFQVGQAINRSKWGVWNLEEYLEMATSAAQILRRRPGIEILGPAVIDFEYHVTATVLAARRPGLYFDVVTSLLYVDRRGAPENRHAGFDTVAKIVLLKAIAEETRSSSGRCWITEMNWPLWEGPHSPAGREVAVDETTQANYLVRYYLLSLGTGLVERVYWWQLAAKGYGLLDPAGDGSLRRRPSFQALATMVDRLSGSRFLGPVLCSPEACLYRFEQSQGGDLVVGWSPKGRGTARLPRPAAAVTNRSGQPLPPPKDVEVQLTPEPCYFELAEE